MISMNCIKVLFKSTQKIASKEFLIEFIRLYELQKDRIEHAKFVSIVMSTENWEDLYHIMYRDGDSWKYSVDLPKGHYEYIYKVDGKFVLDPSVSNTKVYPTTTVMVLEKE
jgi:hypothetical protein